MMTLAAFVLLASATSLPPAQNTNLEHSSVTHPVFVEAPKETNGLTLYNEKGEVVARGQKKGDTFQNCKMEFGVSLDDLMSAWVHAYLAIQR